MLKTHKFTIEEGSDKGKVFLITEMPLLEADRWAWSLGHGMMKGGLDVDQININKMDVKTVGGILEFAKLGVAALGNIERDTLFELLDELTDKCIRIVTESGVTRDLVDGDVTALKTLNYLRMEAVKLHIGFLTQDDN